MAEDFITCRDRECGGLFALQKPPADAELDAAGYVRTAHLDVITRDGNFGHLRVFQKPRQKYRVALSSIRLEGRGQRGMENLAWGSADCGFAVAEGAIPLPTWKNPLDEEEAEPKPATRSRPGPSPLLAVEMNEDDEELWKGPS